MSYKRWLFIAIFLFGIGQALGLGTPADITELFTEDIDALEEFGDYLTSLPQAAVFILIFIRNVSVVLISFTLSPIFCLVPMLTLVINGWLIGLISTPVIEQKSIGFLLAGLLPHGIFELPALIMAEAAALSFGISAMLAVFNREKRTLLLPNLRKNLKYLAIALALLLPAAIIEAYITPLLLD